jgi:PAS domain S-box-containing protein
LSDSKTLAKYLCFAAVLMPLASALIGSKGSPLGYWLQWRLWFFADALAFLTVAPAVWSWAAAGLSWVRNPRKCLELAASITLLFLFGYLAFMRPGQGEQPALLYSLVPLLLWSALRLGVEGISTSLLVVALLSTGGAAHGRGPFAGQAPLNNVLSLQLFLFFAAIPFTFLAALAEGQKRAQRGLIVKERQLTEAQRLAQVGSWQWNLKTDAVNWSEELYRITGRDFNLPPPTYKEHAQFYTRESWERLQAAIVESLRTGQGFDLDLEIARTDGSTRWVLSRSEPQRDSAGRIIFVRGTVKDITERKWAEQSLRESEERFRLVANTAPVMIWMSGVDKGSTYFNKPWLEFTGRPLEDELGNGWAQGVHHEDLGRCLETYKQSFDLRQPFQMEYRLRRHDGEYRWVLDVGVPRYSDGFFVGYIGSAVDVSDKKQAELELRRRGEILARAEELADMGSWQLDVRTKKPEWSDNMYRLLGFQPGEVQPSTDLYERMLSKEDKDRVKRAKEEAIANRRPAEYEMRCSLPDGRVRMLRSLVEPAFSESGELIRMTGTTRDVTEHRNEEERLRRSEALLAQAEKLANMGSWEWNLETSEVTWSDHRYRLAGMHPRASAAPTLDGYWQLVHPADRERVRMETLRSISEARPLDLEARFVLADGQVRIVRTRAAPTVDPQGRTIRLTGMSQDITEETRIREDLHRLSQELLRTQDSERRQLARDLHESAGQTLAAQKMALMNLEDALPEGNEEALRLLEIVRGLAEDAVREIRVLSHLLHPPLLDELGLISALQWYVRGFAERSGIQAIFEVPQDFQRLPQAIETTIFRIVQEALTNVHRYSGSRTAVVRLNAEAGRIHIEIADDGCGLPVISREGSKVIRFGVGIAGMRERVLQLNGKFEIEGTPGRGTTVRVELPIDAAPDPAD